MSRDEHSIIKNYFIVISLTFISNLGGFVKEILIAGYFGISGAVDAFVVAFAFVSIFTLMFAAGPLQGAFIPLFTRYHTAEKEKGWEFFSDIINLVALFCILLSAVIFIVIIYVPNSLNIIAPGFSKIQIHDLAGYINIMLITIVLTSVSVIFISVLQAFGFFSASVTPPILNNIIIILSMVLFAKTTGISTLVWGIVVGALSSFLWLLYFVSKYNPRYRLKGFSFDHRIKEVIIFMLPMGMLIFTDQIIALIQKSIVSVTESGNIAVLNYAYKLVGIPIGLFGMGIATVIFPTLAWLISQKKEERLIEEKITNGLNFLIYTMVPIMVFFITFGLSIVRLVFERGAFSPEASIKTAYALQLYSLGMLGQALIMLLHRVFFAYGDSKLPLKIGLFTAAVHVLFCLAFVGKFDYLGIPMATSVYAYIYITLLLFYLMKKHISFALLLPLKLTFKITSLSIASAAISSLVLRNLPGFERYAIIVCLGIYIVVFFILTYMFRINETIIVFQTFSKYLEFIPKRS